MLAKIVLNFTVTSETNYNQIVGFIQKNKIEHYAIYPLYTGGNLNFFEDFIYLDKDDFNKLDLSKKDVFVNMAMNLHNFGKLTIMPDGKIFANVNDAPLGSINNSVYDIIYKEMAEGSSWLKIRDMKPCNECIYQWLCPSPSNYEFVLGKPNLCNLLP
jgi:pseudo-rSAM protein